MLRKGTQNHSTKNKTLLTENLGVTSSQMDLFMADFVFRRFSTRILSQNYLTTRWKRHFYHFGVRSNDNCHRKENKRPSINIAINSILLKKRSDGNVCLYYSKYFQIVYLIQLIDIKSLRFSNNKNSNTKTCATFLDGLFFTMTVVISSYRDVVKMPFSSCCEIVLWQNLSWKSSENEVRHKLVHLRGRDEKRLA